MVDEFGRRTTQIGRASAILSSQKVSVKEYEATSSWDRRRPRLPTSNLTKNVTLAPLEEMELVLLDAGRPARLRSQDERH